MADTAVGTGSDFWKRRTNRYAGCICPPARYSPIHTKPTAPGCPEHGDARIGEQT